MNVEKAMKTRPAREPLDTLDACIRDFLWRREPGGGMDVFVDDIPAMCAEAQSFEDAVWIAVASKRRNGKMHSHQTKVPKDSRREFGYRIIEAYPNVFRWHGWPVLDSGNLGFDNFYDFLWEVRPAGIGPLTVYDVATRVGAYVELEPISLYLHTGARMGWDAMWNYFWQYRRENIGSPRIHPNSWPPALRALSADQAEDFLCTYRNVIGDIKRDEIGRPV